MRAIIPVAGIGARLRPHTHTQPKALVPVAGKPILAHIVDGLIEGGIKDFVFILGYLGSKIEEFILSHYQQQGLTVRFVLQEPRQGIAHAVWFARQYIENEEDVLIVLGDSIVQLNLDDFLAKDTTMIGVRKVAVPGMFGVAEADRSGKIKGLVEKPKIPKSNLGIVGIYRIKNPRLLIESIEYILKNDYKTYGEYQLTDALMYMVKKGEDMYTYQVEHWYDCGKKESVLEANAILLQNPKYQNIPEDQFPDCIIIPPVNIMGNCRITKSIIGPNVAIGENSIVESSIISNTIIGSFSELENTVLSESIIGNDASLKGISQSLNIGDNTEIIFGQ
ncbi:sugar phosphate nucleotidyltransferase [Roseivirga sp. BDSF3-8]|uniref:sugar phosphate nucleotidyltransferase n=1 Tax=Roseivirga sp. BDSF3-8 TaxID=3241598 RepID=UPI003531CE8B